MSVNPAAPAPSEPYANKAVISALGTVILVALRWAVSDNFTLADEGLITLAGSITTLAVYAVSNFRRILGLKSESGQGIVEAILIVFLVAVCLVVLFHFA